MAETNIMINYLSSLRTNKRPHNDKLHQHNWKPGSIVRGHYNCTRIFFKRKINKKEYTAMYKCKSKICVKKYRKTQKVYDF